MNVPTRQAYLAPLAGSEEQAAAASLTNAARTLFRPLAGLAVSAAVPGLPFVLAGRAEDRLRPQPALVVPQRSRPLARARLRRVRHPLRTRREPRPDSVHAVPFRVAARFWIKLVFINFGGQTGQIAIMHQELAERRRWISNGRYLHTLNDCMLLLGPDLRLRRRNVNVAPSHA